MAGKAHAAGIKAAVEITKAAMVGTSIGVVFGMAYKIGITDPSKRKIDNYYAKLNENK